MTNLIPCIGVLIISIIYAWQYRQQAKKNTELQSKILEILAYLSELTKVYGDTQIAYHNLHAQHNVLNLTAVQFELMSLRNHLIESEQYEAVVNIENLINAVQNAIKQNSNINHEHIS